MQRYGGWLVCHVLGHSTFILSVLSSCVNVSAAYCCAQYACYIKFYPNCVLNTSLLKFVPLFFTCDKRADSFCCIHKKIFRKPFCGIYCLKTVIMVFVDVLFVFFYYRHEISFRFVVDNVLWLVVGVVFGISAAWEGLVSSFCFAWGRLHGLCINSCCLDDLWLRVGCCKAANLAVEIGFLIALLI